MQLVTVEGMQEETDSGRRSHGTRRSAGKVQRHAPIEVVPWAHSQFIPPGFVMFRDLFRVCLVFV